MQLPGWEVYLIGALTDTVTNEETPDIAIYHSARLAIPHNALTGTYPVCCTLVGDDCSDVLVCDTLAMQVSTSPDLYHYRNVLPDVITQSSLACSVSYLADVACLEWYIHWVHYVPDARVEVADAILPARPADTTHAGLVEGTQWIVSPWSVMPIWHARQPGEIIVLSAINLGVSEATVIVAYGHRVVVVDLDPPTATLLAACEAGTSLQVTFETTLTERSDFDLTVYLSGLYRSGLLALSVCPTTLSTGDTL